jgi:membrane protease YdiL (CAAX protease family)
MGEADTCPACGWTYAAPPTEPAVSDESAVVSASEAAIEVPPPLPRADHRALWWEVAVVLAVGVIPNLMGAISFVFQPTPPLPYWLDTLHFAILSGCTILVVMYLIGRSGDGWERFGVVRPRWWDAAIALVLMLVCESIWRIIEGFPWPELATSHVAFPQAQGLADHIMMVAKHGLSAFAEEIVRVYLITRLAVLFRSRGEAVLVSAILFASYHLYQGLPGLANALLIGIAFGIVFLLLRRVWPLALGHALYNIWLELLAS